MNVTRLIILVIAILAMVALASFGAANDPARDDPSDAIGKTAASTLALNLPQAAAIPAAGSQTAANLTSMSMSWSTVTGGGLAGGTSGAFGLSAAAGQPVVGGGSNSEFGLTIGFYRGAQTCFCGLAGDLDADGEYDTVDLNLMITALFFNGDIPHDPTCPSPRTDVNCDLVSDNLDLNELILLLFFNGPTPCNACNGHPL